MQMGGDFPSAEVRSRKPGWGRSCLDGIKGDISGKAAHALRELRGSISFPLELEEWQLYTEHERLFLKKIVWKKRRVYIS